MGLFGELDAAEISDNPFYVAPDVYKCILAEANRVQKKDFTGEGISFKWVIEDEESDYYGSNVSDWLNIYPDVSGDEVTPKIKQSNARLKSRLQEMGLSAEEMDVLLDEDNLENLVGMVAYVTVSESHDKNDPDKVYTNVRKVEVIEE
jgi:hypothetical protein